MPIKLTYDDVDAVQDERDVAAQNLHAVSSVSPDQAAKAVTAGRDLNRPYAFAGPTVEALLAGKRAKDQNEALKTAPRLTQVVTDEEFAAVAQDSLVGLSWWEKSYANFGRAMTAFAKDVAFDASQGPREFLAGIEDVDQAKRFRNIVAGTATPDERQLYRQTMASRAKPTDEVIGIAGTVARVLPQFGFGLEEAKVAAPTGAAAGAALGTLGAGVGAVPGALAGAGLGVMAGQGSSSFWMNSSALHEELSMVRDEKGQAIDPDAVMVASLVSGMVAAPLDMVGFNAIAKTAGFKLLSKDVVADMLRRPQVRAKLVEIGRTYAGAVSVEALTELIQQGVQVMASEATKEVSDRSGATTNLPRRDLGDVGEELGGAARGGAIVAGVLGLPGTVARGTIEVRRTQRAKEAGKLFDAIAANAAETPLSKRDQDRYGATVDQLTRGGPLDTVYVDAGAFREFFQSQDQDAYAAAERLGITREEMDIALREGGSMAMPVGQYAAKVAGSPADAALRPHMKFNPDDMTLAEAQQFERDYGKISEEFATEEAVATEAAAAEDAESAAIRDELAERLRATERYDERTIAGVVEPMVAFYRTQAARLGVPVADVVARVPLPQVASSFASRVAPTAAGQDVAAAIRSGVGPGVSESYLTNLARRESSFNPAAQAGTSSASGLFQFTRGTWENLLAQSAAEIGVDLTGLSRQQILALRNDPNVASRAVAVLTRQNAAALTQSLGRAPTDGELYVAHFMGPANAARLLKADGQATAAELFPDAAEANRSIFYSRRKGPDGKQQLMPRTVAQVIRNLTKEFGVTSTADAAGGVRTGGSAVDVQADPANAALATFEQARATEPLFHGTKVQGLEELTPSERGALGPGVYLTPNENIARRYGDQLYTAAAQEGIFQGIKSRDSSVNPYEVWREQGARLVAAAQEPEVAAQVQEVLAKMQPGDGYPLFKRLAQIVGSEQGAQDLFRAAGFTGISGTADGPEVVVFDPVAVKALTETPTSYYQPSWEDALKRGREMQGMKAAIRDPETGTIYTGYSHQAAINSVPMEGQKGYADGVYGRVSNAWHEETADAGFVTADGEFLSRDEANERWGFGYTMEDARDFLRNRKTFYQSETGPGLGFRSALAEWVAEKGPGKATAEQWKATLKNAPGLKREEIEWIGLNEFLDLPREGPITKAEVAAYIDGHGVTISERVLAAHEPTLTDIIAKRDELEDAWASEIGESWDGGSAYVVTEEVEIDTDEDGEPIMGERFVVRTHGQTEGVYDTEGEAQDAANEMNDEEEREFIRDARYGAPDFHEQALEALRDEQSDDGPEYADYTLPGGTKYREVLLTLPTTKTSPLEEAVAQSPWVADAGLTDEEAATAFREGNMSWIGYPYDDTVAAVRAVRGRSGDRPNKRLARNFTASHWSEPNVVAHARVKDRTSADGKRVLFLEEVQSDWHQQGRDNGYEGEVSEDARAAAVAAYTQAKEALEETSLEVVNAAAPLLEERVRQLDALAQDVTDADAHVHDLWQQLHRKYGGTVHGDQMDAADREAITTAEARRDAAYKAVDSVGFHETKREMRVAVEHIEDMRKGLRSAASTTGNVYRLLGNDRYWRDGHANPDDHLAWLGKVVALRETVLAPDNADRAARLRFTEATNELDRTSGDVSVPNAPFKQSWPALVMKRIIRMAVDEGYDAVAWIRGNQQNGGTTGGDGSFFYERNLVNITNDVLKKAKVKVGVIGIANERSPYTNRVGELEALRDEIEATGEGLRDQELADIRDAIAEAVWQQPGFEITPELKAQAEQGYTLFQPARGSITFTPNQPALIALGQSADPSTFLHESGHFFLEAMIALASGEGATQQQKDDVLTLLKWFGINSTDEIGVAQHEQFAEGIEQYLMEGRSPSPAMQSVFEQFRSWLIWIYRRFSTIRGDLNDDVRGVMDRLLATDDEIAQARELAGLAPLFRNAEEAGSPEAFATYQELHAKAVAATHAAAQARVLSAAKAQAGADFRERRNQIREDVTDEVSTQPIYRAFDWLTAGHWYGTDQPEDLLPFKLSRQQLVDEYGADILKELPRGFGRVYAEDGIALDDGAGVFGFSSGDELVQALRGMERKSEVIERETQAEVNRHLGDPATQGQIPEVAMEASHNIDQATVLEREIQMLTGRPAQRGLAEAARRSVAGRTVRDLMNPDKHLTAERKAARAAMKALADGDREEAARQKYKQLVAFHSWRATKAASKEIGVAQRYFGKFDSPNVRKRLAPNYRAQIDALLEDYDFRQASASGVQRRASLVDFVQAMQAAGREDELNIDASVLERANRTHFSTLTMEELRALKDAVKNLEHLGKLKDELLSRQDHRTFTQAVQELVHAAFMSNVPVYKKADLDPTLPEQARTAQQKIHAQHARFEFVFRRLDGLVDGGPWWTYLFRPLADASAKKADLMREKALALDAIMKDISGNDLNRRTFIPAIGRSLRGETILSFALNMGNEDNRIAVAEGQDWSDAQMEAVFDAVPKAFWVASQKVWSLIETLREPAFDVEEKLTGSRPQAVEATPVLTKYGTFTGGYYPLKYDRSRDPRVTKEQAKQELSEMALPATRPMTRRGHLEARKGSGGRPVQMDLRVLSGHFEQVIHDIAYRVVLKDIDRLTQNPVVQDAMAQRMGLSMVNEIRPWLVEIAKPRVDPRGFQEVALSHLRQGTSIVSMGMKITTAIVQPLGIFNAATRVGYRVFAEQVRLGPQVVYAKIKETMLSFLGKQAELPDRVAFVMSRSAVMRERMTSFSRDADELVDRIMEGWPSKVKRSFFYLTGMLDLTVSAPTWITAYELASADRVEGVDGSNEADVIAYADSVVRMTVGSGEVKDLPPVMRGNELRRLFTTFYSYMNLLYNELFTEQFPGVTSRDIPPWVFAANMVLLWAAPSILADLITGRLDEDDDDEIGADDITAQVIRTATYPVGTVVLVRDAASGVLSFGKYDAQVTPVAGAFQAFAGLGKLAVDVTDDEPGVKRTTVKDLVVGGGYIGHYPSRQLWLSGEYAYDYLNGTEEEFDLYQFLVKRDKKTN